MSVDHRPRYARGAADLQVIILALRGVRTIAYSDSLRHRFDAILQDLDELVGRVATLATIPPQEDALNTPEDG